MSFWEKEGWLKKGDITQGSRVPFFWKLTGSRGAVNVLAPPLFLFSDKRENMPLMTAEVCFAAGNRQPSVRDGRNIAFS